MALVQWVGRGKRRVVNQTVVQMYLVVLVAVGAAVLSVWPRPRRRIESPLRFVGVLVGGMGLLLAGFHAPGRVESVRVLGDEAFVLERHRGRVFSPEVWTALSLDGAGATRRLPPPGNETPWPVHPEAGAMSVPRTVQARAERPGPRGREPVGPMLVQPVLVASGPGYAVVSAFEAPGRTQTVHLVRLDRSGRAEWRLEAKDLGLSSGSLARAAPLPGGEHLLLFVGVLAERSPWAWLSVERRVVAVRVDLEAGRVRWRLAF